MITPELAASEIKEASPRACGEINLMAEQIFLTRGGRVGSGMGGLLESLWGYYINHILGHKEGDPALCEIGWMADHEYNDFACLRRDQPWDPKTKMGELLRIEAKSMVLSADESKGHFDEIQNTLNDHDLLLVIVWRWESLDSVRVYPKIVDSFIDYALPVAKLRDALHLKRGGTFANKDSCPDGCPPSECLHHGEPLNAAGKRERIRGPSSCKPTGVSFAANFGGLIRMLKTNSQEARDVFRGARKKCEVAHKYISFIHRNFPKEELNSYTNDEWKALAKVLNIKDASNKNDIQRKIRESDVSFYYHELMKNLF